jgi:hypothetical protein
MRIHEESYYMRLDTRRRYACISSGGIIFQLRDSSRRARLMQRNRAGASLITDCNLVSTQTARSYILFLRREYPPRPLVLRVEVERRLPQQRQHRISVMMLNIATITCDNGFR